MDRLLEAMEQSEYHVTAYEQFHAFVRTIPIPAGGFRRAKCNVAQLREMVRYCRANGWGEEKSVRYVTQNWGEWLKFIKE